MSKLILIVLIKGVGGGERETTQPHKTKRVDYGHKKGLIVGQYPRCKVIVLQQNRWDHGGGHVGL
jgi:hypothetical protein